METPLDRLVVGTRGSQMALVQAKQVADKLSVQNPGLTVELKVITTKGDTNESPIPLDTMGKEWFTKEIEQALLDKSIDLAVHSLKDLPPETPEGLVVLPVMERDDARDALVAKTATSLSALPKGATVGTDSLRRKVLLLALRPDLHVTSIRGNANTRLKKLEEGQCDALVMAAAGLRRIGRPDTITELFDPSIFVPAIGQGALAVEIHEGQPTLQKMIEALQHKPSVAAISAERAFAQTVGGGCKLPVGCYAYFDNNTVHIHGMVGSMDGQLSVTKTVTGPASEAVRLAQQLAAELVKEPFVAEY